MCQNDGERPQEEYCGGKEKLYTATSRHINRFRISGAVSLTHSEEDVTTGSKLAHLNGKSRRIRKGVEI
jgi:hypothetical protein